jgi:excisionase family DNA binding protein
MADNTPMPNSRQPDSFEWNPPRVELLDNNVWEGFDVQGLEDGPVALDGQEYLSPQDVGKMVGLHPRVIQRAVNAGEIGAFKLRGRIRIKRTDLEAWIADNRVEPQTLPEYGE